MYFFVNMLNDSPIAFSKTNEANPAPILEYSNLSPGLFFK